MTNSSGSFGDESKVEWSNQSTDNHLQQEQDSYPCPRCAENIKKAALVCRFCGAKLKRQPAAQTETIEQKQARDKHNSNMALFFILWYPLGFAILFIAGLMLINVVSPPTGDSKADPTLPPGWHYYRIYNSDLPSDQQVYFELVCTKAPYDENNPAFSNGCKAVVPDGYYGSSPDHLTWCKIPKVHLERYAHPVQAKDVPPVWRTALEQEAARTAYWK